MDGLELSAYVQRHVAAPVLANSAVSEACLSHENSYRESRSQHLDGCGLESDAIGNGDMLGAAGRGRSRRPAMASGEPRSAYSRLPPRRCTHYFIQRELCGLRRHHDVIREYQNSERGPGAARGKVSAAENLVHDFAVSRVADFGCGIARTLRRRHGLSAGHDQRLNPPSKIRPRQSAVMPRPRLDKRWASRINQPEMPENFASPYRHANRGRRASSGTARSPAWG